MADRRTDGRTEFSSLDRVCIAYSAVKSLEPPTVRGKKIFPLFRSFI